MSIFGFVDAPTFGDDTDDETEYLSGNNRFADPGLWSSRDPSGWYEVSSWVKDEYGLSSSTQYKTRVNRAADIFMQRNGRWPSAMEMQSDPTLNGYMYNIAVGFNQLPPSFAVDGEAYYNDPWDGPTQLRTIQNINTELGPGGIDAMLESGTMTNYGTFQEPKNSWTRDEFSSIMMNLGPARGGGSGGSSGGGAAGRTNIAFDRAQLIEQASDRWRSLMLEEGDNIEGIVDAYIDKSNAFWIGEAGRLDFDTFVVNKARDTGRYKQLYSRLPAHQTEEEYIAGFRQTSERFGLNPTATRRETVAGAEAGVGLAGFSDRVGRTSEARLANTGGFSQQLASTFGAMPGLAGS